jgi:hypothetical protein
VMDVWIRSPLDNISSRLGATALVSNESFAREGPPRYK